MPKRRVTSRRPWTAEDKAELARLVKQHGTNWPLISKTIRRSESTTRNYWHDYVKPNGRKVNRTRKAQDGLHLSPPGPKPKTQPRIIKPDTPPEVQPATLPDEPGVADGGVYPTDHQLFDVLRNSPKTLAELSRIFDRSPETITKRLDTLEVEGWYLIRENDQISVPVSLRPRVTVPVATLADVEGREISLGVSSDLHAGSRWAQPTAYNKFRRIAYDEFGVRMFLEPGDKTAGIYGYKGQDQDLIPACRPVSRQDSYGATYNQVWLASQCMVPLEGATTYILGGNHDWFHVTANGHDPVKMLCSQRTDVIYCGYDHVSIPLTKDMDVRMWHPSGGIPYARSYRMQKGLESQAFADLRTAIAKDRTPKVSALIAGHLHIVIPVPMMPIMGLHPGCFEAQSNYLKRKGLVPDVGGSILTFRLTENGHVQRITWTWIPFDEIEDDWENWPLPEEQHSRFEPDNVGVIFSFQELRDPKLTPAGPVPSGPEYSGAH